MHGLGKYMLICSYHAWEKREHKDRVNQELVQYEKENGLDDIKRRKEKERKIMKALKH